MPKIRCASVDVRGAAYEMLTELARDCADNWRLVADLLTDLHHRPDAELAKQWDVSGLGLEGKENCFTEDDKTLKPLRGRLASFPCKALIGEVCRYKVMKEQKLRLVTYAS